MDWKKGVFICEQETYRILFRDLTHAGYSPFFKPTRIEDWKIMPSQGMIVEIHKNVTKFRGAAPRRIRDKFKHFMRDREVSRDGYCFEPGVFPYQVKGKGDKYKLVLCEGYKESIDLPL